MKNLSSVLLMLLFVPTFALAAFGDWRPAQGDLYDSLRANAPYYWKWISQFKQDPLIKPAGVVTGDAHILNFGDIELNQGAREYGLIDLDDSGVDASLFADFLHYYIGNQLSSYKVPGEDLWNAYLAGLSGQPYQTPRVLQEALAQSDQDFNDLQNTYLDKITKKNHFSKKAGLDDIANADTDIQDMYAEVQATFKSEMSGLQILDSGYKVKKNGGSQGLPRFWFLLADSQGQKHVWEFKQEVDAATSLYSAQAKDPQIRFQQIAQIYRPEQKVRGPYRFLRAGSYTFLLRERLASFLKLDPTKKLDQQSVSDGSELSIYLAYAMGHWQGQQPGGHNLFNTIQQDSTGSLQHLQMFAQKFINEMLRLGAIRAHGLR